MNRPTNPAWITIGLAWQNISPRVRGLRIARMFRLTCLGFVMHGGLCSAAAISPVTALVSLARRHHSQAVPAQLRLQRMPVILASSTLPDHGTPENLGELKTGQIMVADDGKRTTLKFFQLVVLPLSVCFALVFLLRRGFLS